MKTVLFYALASVAAVALLVGISWFSLVASRPMAKFSKETGRQVYMNSVAHQQGADAGVAIDCSNMRNASLPSAQRHAFASLVIQDAASYGGNASLSDESKACVREANSLLVVALA